MEFRVLKYFLETARESSITRAAERLHVTQQTMSKQLTALKKEATKRLYEIQENLEYINSNNRSR